MVLIKLTTWLHEGPGFTQCPSLYLDGRGYESDGEDGGGPTVLFYQVSKAEDGPGLELGAHTQVMASLSRLSVVHL